MNIQWLTGFTAEALIANRGTAKPALGYQLPILFLYDEYRQRKELKNLTLHSNNQVLTDVSTECTERG